MFVYLFGGICNITFTIDLRIKKYGFQVIRVSLIELKMFKISLYF